MWLNDFQREFEELIRSREDLQYQTKSIAWNSPGGEGEVKRSGRPFFSIMVYKNAEIISQSHNTGNASITVL